MIKRAGLFERVSTEEQAKFGFSIKTQVDALEEYCKKEQIKIVDHYTDEGVSAGRPYQKRPEMKRLLEDVEAGKIDIILFTRLDRWFRNVPEYFKVQEILDKAGVQWKAIWEDYDTTSANGRMAITIFLAIAQNEREKTAERIKVVFENKVKNGEACFGGPIKPFGYMKQEDENGVVRLVKDPDEQAMVQDFWDTLIADHNLNKAIRKMNDVYDVHKDWKTWKRISQNTFYCGQYKDNIDFCEPYVSPEDFLKYQDSRPVKQTPTGRVYYFTGMMRCPQCGNKLCGDTCIKPYGVYKQYRCRIRGRGCSNHTVYAERKIEKQLLEKLEKLLEDAIQTTEVGAAKPKAKPKTDIKKLKEKLRRLDVVYMAGNLTDSEYLQQQKELKERIKTAENEAPPEPPNVEPLKNLLATDFRSIYKTLTEQEKQRFWQKLIKGIDIGEDKIIRGVTFF